MLFVSYIFLRFKRDSIVVVISLDFLSRHNMINNIIAFKSNTLKHYLNLLTYVDHKNDEIGPISLTLHLSLDISSYEASIYLNNQIQSIQYSFFQISPNSYFCKFTL
ncbi:transcription activator of gluconeogenesis ert1 [Gossypium arboreum]|uniref:Transcription activator of gluconeogenesis ert1 n=1 Tax=Gossypium arboreum TaxID=29729 RepID=A0A0B0PWA3_GOSAR|nr:transcription activator of gluconeogenesis ert1 [Gossypium arboreum]